MALLKEIKRHGRIAPMASQFFTPRRTGFVGTEAIRVTWPMKTIPRDVSVNVTQPVRDDRFTVTMNSTHITGRFAKRLSVLRRGHHHAITS